LDQKLNMKIPLAFLLLGMALFAGEPQFSDVFTAGKDGWPSIRIPSVVVTKGGTVLAFAEARAKRSDQASNKIVLKRSTDGGATWGAVQLIHDDGANSLNNPTALATDSGRIFLMYQRIPAHMHETSKETATGFKGENVYRTFLVTSDDDGATWAKPLDVTRGTKHATGATTVASGPGIGIQLTRGPHKGRLVMPFNEGPFWKWNNYVAFSDDGGKTWRCGENAPGAFVPDAKLGERSQINEVQMVELSDGGVRLNSRTFAGARVRKTAVSKDGGETWSRVEDVPALRDPSCMASIFRHSFDDGAGKGCVLYSGPDSTKRENGTIHLSFDDGATWPVQRVLFPGSFAYSVLTRLKDGTLGCLFETDGANRIVFARFTMDWLSEAKDVQEKK
jgi:sialidase-1